MKDRARSRSTDDHVIDCEPDIAPVVQEVEAYTLLSEVYSTATIPGSPCSLPGDHSFRLDAVLDGELEIQEPWVSHPIRHAAHLRVPIMFDGKHGEFLYVGPLSPSLNAELRSDPKTIPACE